MTEHKKPEVSFVPILEPTTRLVAELEKLQTNDVLRVLILVRILRDLHSAVPSNQMINKPLEIIVPSILGPKDQVLNMEDQLREGVVRTKQAIMKEIKNEYWRFILAREMLMATVQKQLAKEGKQLRFSLGSLPNAVYDRVELSDQIAPLI